jgi:polyisoprenoid-binding protein YceI
MPKIFKSVLAIVIAVVVLVTAGTFIYIHFIDNGQPAPLTLQDQSSQSSQPSSSGNVNASNWKATNASQVGYRVKENLFGQDTVAVGRTNSVTGTLTVDGTTVKTVDLSVDMTTVKSDQGGRDRQFQGRIMSTDTYPTATFKLTKPIQLASRPSKTVQTVSATGDLTLRGVTKSVTTDLQIVLDGGNVKANGSIPITFADYKIPNPSFGGVSTDDKGTLELLVVFAPAS